MKEDNILIYTLLPSYIYLTKDLTSEEKLIAERITALCRKRGYAWISNKALADMYGIREDTVSKHIKKLKDIGFIKCTYSKEDLNKSSRIIYLTNNVWAKQVSGSSLNNQYDKRYMNGYNNKSNYNMNNNIPNDIITYDEDGTMLWHGKRCESTPCPKEEQEHMRKLLRSDDREL